MGFEDTALVTHTFCIEVSLLVVTPLVLVAYWDTSYFLLKKKIILVFLLEKHRFQLVRYLFSTFIIVYSF